MGFKKTHRRTRKRGGGSGAFPSTSFVGEEVFNNPLLPWVKIKLKGGREYWHNKDTMKTTWYDPTATTVSPKLQAAINDVEKAKKKFQERSYSILDKISDEDRADEMQSGSTRRQQLFNKAREKELNDKIRAVKEAITRVNDNYRRVQELGDDPKRQHLIQSFKSQGGKRRKTRRRRNKKKKAKKTHKKKRKSRQKKNKTQQPIY